MITDHILETVHANALPIIMEETEITIRQILFKVT